MKAAGGAFDAQLYLELNRALVSSDGDAALVALADLIRCRHIRVSEDAWTFLRYAVQAQRRSPDTEQAPERTSCVAFRPAERNL